MPADVAALQDAVDQQVGLVVAERLAQHALHVLVGVGAPACCCSPASVGELRRARSSTRSRGTDFMLARSSRPGFCTSFGDRCLNTAAASSSPSDISRMAAFFEAGFVERHGCVACACAASGGFAADPAAHDAGDRGRVVLGERARAFESGRYGAPSAGERRRAGQDCSSSTTASSCVPGRAGCAGRAASALFSAGRTRPKKTSSATSASAGRHAPRRAAGRSARAASTAARLGRRRSARP